MSTVILRWNPAISSFKRDELVEMIQSEFWPELNWSVWEYDKVSFDDEVYMVRVGEGNTGIVMHGWISSEPYSGEDWSGKGRTTYYCDIDLSTMIDSDTTQCLTTQELDAAMPSFDWGHGHSGVMLPQELEAPLAALWEKFIEEHEDIFDDISATRF